MTDTDALRRLAAATTLVTVTYADRIHFLGELLRRAFDQEGMERAVIVSNASRSNLALLEEKWGNRVQIIRLTENTGSANGYAVGIQAALDGGAHYLWLMDDDNAPKQGSLAILHEQLGKNSAKLGAGRAAVLGFRRDHQADIAEGVPMAKAIPPRSSFFGFHYRQIPFKVWRRLYRGASTTRGLPVLVALPYAPYGGVLAERQLFESIGLPQRELVLYADDTEYTHRITASGGAIVLVTRAEIDDLEGSWNLKESYGNSFAGWLKGGSDFRAFYAARNQAWFDKNAWASSRFQYELNRAIYCGLLWFFAIRIGAKPRLRLLHRAIKDGRAALLGIDNGFPLS